MRTLELVLAIFGAGVIVINVGLFLALATRARRDRLLANVLRQLHRHR